MNMVRWNPFREFEEMFGRVPAFPGESSNENWFPAADISEDHASFQIELEIPAVARKNVEVSVSDGVLMVNGERTLEERSEGKHHRIERRYGKFTRSFRLPENADEQSIKASSRDGVLQLVISKKEAEGPRVIDVRVE
ncbi:MAG: Hsp20/alpha crystallin family protein [Pseudomonadales bacterium]|nr:Hsp20/alpha crystallin family protein [Pseudomonadales bacterium]MDP6471935.1 Hsp20/alpha crystallin family protein [Pseudomonadales bacterium]MDP6826795.1 Hsp20/alpha crystallin family protein [Pseudomonadales bacterium]MDP6970927.1 Hsp20/alpha crystallin family protein [Pseudomonadales bacterium]